MKTKIFTLFIALISSIAIYAQSYNCVANFNYYLYTGYQYHFYASTTSGNQNTYSWNFGNGTELGSGIYPWHTFSGPGTYNVCLTVYDINPTSHDTLCSNTTCQTIIVADTNNCVASFNYYLYTGYQYHFYANAPSGNQNTYSWNFGDSSALGSNLDPWHTFSSPGTYHVCLTAYDILVHDTLCSDTTCQTIIVADTNHCVANFNYYLYTGYQYHFYANASSGNQNTYSWNFGDSSALGSNLDPWHTFSSPGTYHVCLTVYDILVHDTLCSKTLCQTIIVADTNNCVASFNYYHTGYQYHFYSNASSGNQNTYSWNFGDGSALGSTLDPWHTFSGPGTYNVCLTVYDILVHDTLCSDTTCQTIIVADTNNCVASFNYYHTGYQYHFYSNASSGNQNTYSWNFGDSSALGSTLDPWHTFSSPGTYHVCLTVYDILVHDTLCSDTTCQTIIVADTNNCVASFNYYHTGYQYHFYSNASSGNQNTYSWNFGDSSALGSGHDTLHTFSGPGTYQICLTVYDILVHDTLCSDTTCQTIIVPDTSNCVASFNYYNFTGYQYHFYANILSGNQNTYSWNFGDSSALSNGIYILHTFPGEGTYNICLTVYDISLGDTLCSKTLCQTLIIADTTICTASFLYYQYQGSSTTYHFYENAQTGGQNTYNWDFGDGTFIDTTYTGVFNLESHTFPGDGTYNVCLTVYDISLGDTLCSDIMCDSIIINNSGIKESDKNNFNLIIYPNPVIDNLNIELNSESINEFIFDISNVLGQHVKGNTIILNKGKHNIVWSIGDLPKGIYILTITSADKKFVGMAKFIK